MGKCPCGTTHNHDVGTLGRSVAVFAMGLLYHMPIMHHALPGIVDVIIFVVMSAYVAYVLRKDFPEQIMYVSLMTFGLSMVLLGLLLSQGPLSMSIFIIGIALSTAVFTLSDDTLINLSHSFADALYHFKFTEFKLTWRMSSVERSILFLVALYWVNTTMSLVSFGSFGAFMFDEACLALGMYQVSTFLKIQIEPCLVESAHGAHVINCTDGRTQIPLSSIKKGMAIEMPANTLIPVECLSCGKSEIINTHTEKLSTIENNQPIEAHSIICKGSKVIASANCPSVTQKSGDMDHKLFLDIFVMMTLALAVIGGTCQALLTGSIVVGLEVFSISLIASCPCIFVTIRPIIHKKLMDFLGKKVKSCRVPSVGLPDIIVFDRTHTLFNEDPKNREGPYIPHSQAREILQYFKDNNVSIYILSGHHVEHEENLKRCREFFDNLVPADHIIFSENYSQGKLGNPQDKASEIRKLQRYGSLTPPERGVASFRDKVCKFFKINRYNVAMVGDGINDVGALRCADVAVAISPLKTNNFDHEVLEASHFGIVREDLKSLIEIFKGLQRTYQVYSVFIATAFLYHSLMLLGVNGFIPGITASIVAPCSSFFCITMLVLAAMFSMDTSYMFSWLKVKEAFRGLLSFIKEQMSLLFHLTPNKPTVPRPHASSECRNTCCKQHHQPSTPIPGDEHTHTQTTLTA